MSCMRWGHQCRRGIRRARRLLFYETVPRPVAFQVDGSGEFRGEFETFCRQQDIALHVIPPKSPPCGSQVENANATPRRRLFVPQRHGLCYCRCEQGAGGLHAPI